MAGTLALVATVWTQDTAQAQSNRWGESYFPNLPVVTQDGETLRFYDDVIKGRIVVVSFIYTNCPDICPLTTARIAQVEEKLGGIVGRDIFLVSMTVDPERDTPRRLKEFSAAFGAGPGWRFLTGRPEDIRAINARLGDKSRTLSEHRNEIVLGNDATGEWARNSVFGDLDRLIMDIRSMDPRWRDEVRQPKHDETSNTGYPLDLQPGRTLFKKICAPCHTIGVGDRVGPDLRGVTERRDHGWLESFIRQPDMARARRDPVALELVARFPGVRMPGLGVAEADATDLIAYLHAETSRLNDAQAPVEPERASHQHHHHH
jgi:cytochrome oxidase Cu insertion factor (SCO1/SenC/PrrC family)/cytochrome c2